ncbi:MAG: hypothetical protein B7C24_14975 [Bacteroidetes bacterium 4572_77]|nr:MAG: hypothetical protein B7C24_14975 [Bacteroidetes bacterium 4572_77]
MKKYLLITAIAFLIASASSQEVNSVAVNDTISAKMGETLTIYPLLNDYDPDGDEIIIDTARSSSVNILSYTDSTITFKVPDYSLNDNLIIHYNHPDSIYYPPCRAHIYIQRILTIDTLNCNQIKTPIYPGNLQFWNGYFKPYYGFLYKYPYDEKTSTIYVQDIWIGGKDQNEDLHLAAEIYQRHGVDYWSGPLSDDGLAQTDSINAGKWFRTWKVAKTEVVKHINNYQNPDYQIPEAIETWPAHGDIKQADFLAPFVDVDLDNEYHPENGDYPLIKGDESIFFIFNDHLEHTETGGLPLGVEIHCMAWAYEDTKGQDALNNTIFMSYKFFNRSMQTYYDTYIGLFTDFDIGYYGDDFIGCDVENGNYYAYNGKPIDGNGQSSHYGENPPSQAVSILGGPYMDNDGLDNPLGECDEGINGAGFGDGIIDNERYGLGSFMYFSFNPFQAMSTPKYADEFYNYMSGNWLDETPLVYGGNGHPVYGGDSLFPTRFLYPGDSDPCNWGTNGLQPSWDSLWTEETTGNHPNDRRGTGSTGPFTFEARSVHYLDIALVTAPGGQEKNSNDLLQEYVSQIKQDYLLHPEEFGNQYLNIPEETKTTSKLLIYPNPAYGDIISFELNNEQEAQYYIYSATGQIIENGNLAAQKEHNLNIGHLKAGWYILEVKIGDRILHSKMIL